MLCNLDCSIWEAAICTAAGHFPGRECSQTPPPSPSHPNVQGSEQGICAHGNIFKKEVSFSIGLSSLFCTVQRQPWAAYWMCPFGWKHAKWSVAPRTGGMVCLIRTYFFYLELFFLIIRLKGLLEEQLGNVVFFEIFNSIQEVNLNSDFPATTALPEDLKQKTLPII